MRVIIGYGNTLRGEDGFGVEVLRQLQKFDLENTKFVEAYQLTPELCLELLDADEVIFIDAFYSKNNEYSLIVPLSSYTDINISHHMSPQFIIEMLKNIYQKNISYCIFSMATSYFDFIFDEEKYYKNIQAITDYLK